MITIDPAKCPQNHPCPSVEVCPAGALTQKGFDLPEIDQEKCTLCRTCVETCPRQAIQESEA